MPIFSADRKGRRGACKNVSCAQNGCHEGFGYWRYGFGYFLIYASLILEYTGGSVNYFEREKVKNIALFPQKIRMGKKKAVSFSDGGDVFSIGSGTICYLRSIYGEDVKYPSVELLSYGGNIYCINELLWFDTDYKEDEARSFAEVFEDSQWMISRNDTYSFAAKGGNNGEPHNHNDVGSFMIVADDDTVPLADIGAEKYRRETFRPETRYNILNHASWGHSVPIINGNGYQICGNEYCAKNIDFSDRRFALDIEGAYEPGIVGRIHREFLLGNNGIVLCDTFEFSDRTEFVTERFVTFREPKISDGVVDLGGARIIFDEDNYTVSYSADSYIHHSREEKVSVYLIDFNGIDKSQRSFEFEIEMD